MKKFIVFVALFVFVLQFGLKSVVAADLSEGHACAKPDGSAFTVGEKCAPSLICKPPPYATDIPNWICQKDTSVVGVIGQINPPDAVSRMGFGAAGLSTFLTKAVALIYTISGVLFFFMIVVSAIQWIMSGGDKEGIASARKRLIYAIVGITILALAFVILKTLGQITGFQFFGT